MPIALLACGGESEPLSDKGGGVEVAPGSLLASPFEPFPAAFSDVGLYRTRPLDTSGVPDVAVEFEPVLPLYSDSLQKQRFLVLPEGGTVDISDRERWAFPDGTLLFKTFSVEDASEQGGVRPVETRVLRRAKGGAWDYGVYQWDDGGTKAVLLPMKLPVGVPLVVGGQQFNHAIPAKLDCRQCHESNSTVVIGFDELRLNGKRAGHTATQLTELHERGILRGALPAKPDAVEEGDEASRAVIGYVHGNCAHCHNATGGPSSSFDMRHGVMVENTVNKETESSASAAGIRIVPGHPEESILFLAFSGETDDPDVKPMPPVGVELRDTVAIEMLRDWIVHLEAGQ